MTAPTTDRREIVARLIRELKADLSLPADASNAEIVGAINTITKLERRAELRRRLAWCQS